VTIQKELIYFLAVKNMFVGMRAEIRTSNDRKLLVLSVS
jgi:hypothetical protein